MKYHNTLIGVVTGNVNTIAWSDFLADKYHGHSQDIHATGDGPVDDVTKSIAYEARDICVCKMRTMWDHRRDIRAEYKRHNKYHWRAPVVPEDLKDVRDEFEDIFFEFLIDYGLDPLNEFDDDEWKRFIRDYKPKRHGFWSTDNEICPW